MICSYSNQIYVALWKYAEEIKLLFYHKYEVKAIAANNTESEARSTVYYIVHKETQHHFSAYDHQKYTQIHS